MPKLVEDKRCKRATPSAPSLASRTPANRLALSNFFRWFAIGVVTYAACAAVPLIFVAVIFGLKAVLLPYGLFLGCGLVLTPLLYWVRQARFQPKSCAIRFASLAFVYFQLFALIVLFSGIRLGVLQRSTVLHGYIPLLVPGAIISSAVVYTLTQKRLTAMHGRH